MIDKTPMGVLQFVDEEFGGALRGRPVLICGESGTGKTVAAFHFISRGLRLDERCLMLSARPAADLLIQAESMGMDLSEAVEEGSLTLLEYGDDVPGRHSDATITLPPDSFVQLANVIAEQAVARLVLDTCLPWVAIRNNENLAEHVFSFIRSLDRMGVTAMLTMPRPVSLAAARLYKLVEDQVPISVSLRKAEPESEPHILIVNKYIGMDEKVGQEIPYRIVAGQGIVVDNQSGGVPPESVSATYPVSGTGGVRFSGIELSGT